MNIFFVFEPVKKTSDQFEINSLTKRSLLSIIKQTIRMNSVRMIYVIH